MIRVRRDAFTLRFPRRPSVLRPYTLYRLSFPFCFERIFLHNIFSVIIVRPFTKRPLYRVRCYHWTNWVLMSDFKFEFRVGFQAYSYCFYIITRIRQRRTILPQYWFYSSNDFVRSILYLTHAVKTDSQSFLAANVRYRKLPSLWPRYTVNGDKPRRGPESLWYDVRDLYRCFSILLTPRSKIAQLPIGLGSIHRAASYEIGLVFILGTFKTLRDERAIRREIISTTVTWPNETKTRFWGPIEICRTTVVRRPLRPDIVT